jgi:hypothetical protein
MAVKKEVTVKYWFGESPNPEWGKIVKVEFPDGNFAYLSRAGLTLKLKKSVWKKAFADKKTGRYFDVNLRPYELELMLKAFDKGMQKLAKKKILGDK